MILNKMGASYAYLLGISKTPLKKDKCFVCLKSFYNIERIINSFNVVIFTFKVSIT